MANSIRTPRLGTNATSRRIAQAVDDEDWQEIRLSMKGIPTESKLKMLEWYYGYGDHQYITKECDDCDVCIRIDNYIKALCRGGQLNGGESLKTVLEVQWKPTIRK
jgi:hypothetical protein